mmetsp:Transcript_166710/g.405136  ORF Transcript_166710/g.405136 Transcript_166710/m.405136 type:complete len:470 (-) Transcript_166710:2873-4282(-)
MVECTNVRDERGCDQTVTGQTALLSLELVDLDSPALVLGRETVDKPHCKTKLDVTPLGLLLHSLLLSRGFHELILQPLQLRLNTSHLLFNRCEVRQRAVLRLRRFGQGVHQRLHLHVDPVVLVDVHHPRAQVRRRERLRDHRVVREVRVRSVRLQCSHKLLRHHRGVVRLQALQEVINLGHHLLRAIPRLVLELVLQHHETAGGDVVDTAGRLREGLQLRQRRLVQAVDGLLRGNHRRFGLSELRIGLTLRLVGSGSSGRRLLGLDLRKCLLLLSLTTLLPHHHKEFIGRLDLLLHLDHCVLQVNLQLSNIGGSLPERGQTDIKAFDEAANRSALLGKDVLVERNQLEEGLRCHVVVAPLVLQVADRDVRYRHVYLSHMICDVVLHLWCHTFQLLDETASHGLKCLTRPRVEPIDDRARDQTRETAGTDAERVADGRERKDDVQVLANARHKEVLQGVRHVGNAVGLGL